MSHPRPVSCCGIDEPHEHLCDLGPLGWIVRTALRWVHQRRAIPTTGGHPDMCINDPIDRSAAERGVQLPDDDVPEGPEVSPEEAAYHEEMAREYEERGELAGAPREIDCYACNQPMTPQERARYLSRIHTLADQLLTAPSVLEWYEAMLNLLDDYARPRTPGVPISRKVTKLGPIVEAQRDPTQTYELECGHTVI